jgi:outer membrane protein TolC
VATTLSQILELQAQVRAMEHAIAVLLTEPPKSLEAELDRADLYPKFDLVGAASFTGSDLSSLLSGSNLGEVGAGAIMWPIFHGGKIQANIRSKKEEEKQAYFVYSKTVLGALQNAEDALARYATEQQRKLELQRAVSAAQSSSTIALQQYRAGFVTYVNVLTAQANELSARDQLEQSRQAFATDLVSLFKALGGGWQVSA